MASNKTFREIQFPLAGLSRKYAVQNQPEYTTPDAQNVWPYTLGDNRMRGGSRPGSGPYFADGATGKINLLSTVIGSRYEFEAGDSDGGDVSPTPDVDGSFLVSFFDDFTGSAPKSYWEQFGTIAVPGVSATPPNSIYNNPVALVRKALLYDVAKPFTLSIGVSHYNQYENYGVYTIYSNLAATPAVDDGFAASVEIDSAGTVTASLSFGGASIYSGVISGAATVGTLALRVQPVGGVTASWDNKVFYTDSTARTLTGGTRFGFQLSAVGEGSVAPIDWLSFSYYENIGTYPTDSETADGTVSGRVVVNQYAEMICGGAGGGLYLEKPQSLFAPVGNTLATQQEGYVMAQPRLRKMFVADWGKIKGQGTGGNLTATTTFGTTGDTVDFTTLGIVAGDDVLVLSDVTSGMTAGAYAITAVAATALTISGYAGGLGACAWSVCVSPKVYDPGQGTYVSWLADVGMVPVNCPLICLYRDRIVLAGAASEPHLWYMSRQGDPFDWNYTEDTSSSATDTGLAVAGQNSDAGLIGKPIRALIPHTDDYLLFGYDNELWILKGDPMYNGQISCLSRTVGVCGKRAWCYGVNGEVYFLSRDGVYVVAGGSYPQQISRAKLPDELLKYSWKDNIQLAYDVRAHGVYIMAEGKSVQWFFSLEGNGFWPVVFGSGITPTALLQVGEIVLIGCSDGKIRYFSREATTDDGFKYPSFVVCGPVRVGNSEYTLGVLQRLDTTLCGSANAVGTKLQIYSGDEAEETGKNYQGGDATAEAVLSKSMKVNLKRVRGGAVLIKIGQDNLGEWWGMERLGMYARLAGRFRE